MALQSSAQHYDIARCARGQHDMLYAPLIGTVLGGIMIIMLLTPQHMLCVM